MASEFEAVIGLEVHAQLLSESKLFCPASAAYGAAPNTNISPVSLGLPGALPVPNARAVEMAVRAGLALQCRINRTSRFDRKHYFYPDLPKGYQITQYEIPIAEHGHLDIEIEGRSRRARINRVHMEEDAAKNLHGVGASDDTLIDFNRAGVPLIEIVGEPDLRSAAEAEAYLRKLREILIYLGVNDGNLEEGSFRCDANVSIRPRGSDTLGTRTELKNINSFRFVRKAIESEIARQEVLVSSGDRVVQETRTWGESQGKTVSMRGKEEAHDYRYFPDPDLPLLRLEAEQLESIRRSNPELAEAKRQRWQHELSLPAYDTQVLTQHPAVARFFEGCVQALTAQWDKDRQADGAKKVANFLQSEVLRHVSTDGLRAEIPVTAEQIAELLSLIDNGTLSGKMAKEILPTMINTGRNAKDIVDEKGLAQVSDTASIEALVKEVIEANADKAAKYREGKTTLLGFFVGQIMKKTKGAANPKVVNDILIKHLG